MFTHAPGNMFTRALSFDGGSLQQAGSRSLFLARAKVPISGGRHTNLSSTRQRLRNLAVPQHRKHATHPLCNSPSLNTSSTADGQPEPSMSWFAKPCAGMLLACGLHAHGLTPQPCVLEARCGKAAKSQKYYRAASASLLGYLSKAARSCHSSHHLHGA